MIAKLVASLAPYRLIAFAVLVLGILAVAMSLGYKRGVKAEAKRVAPVIEQLTAANDSLTLRVREVEAAMREANAKAQQEVAKAREQQAAGAQAVAEAQAAKQRLQGRMSTLERQLQAERAGCSEGEARVCGVPLR